MARVHDKMGIACAGACAVHCATTAAFLLAGGSLLAGGWAGMVHGWLMPVGVLMVALGIVPALWRHRSIAVGGATLAGLALWALAMVDPAHGVVAIGLELAGAACLVAAHWMNMTTARRTPARAIGCEQGMERTAGEASVAGQSIS